MVASPAYDATRDRVEHYFDRTATRTWERLTSDAPVSRIRETVRAGRDKMRALMLSRLPLDLRGARVLDAGCGAGQMSTELAARGSDVLGIDLSPQLVGIAEARLPAELRPKVRFETGDMLAADHGSFDAVIAMDSLIYYDRADLFAALKALAAQSDQVVFTVAPRTPLLQAMWWAGKLFPRSDRSPMMVPQVPARLPAASVGRVHSGFYISECMEHRR